MILGLRPSTSAILRMLYPLPLRFLFRSAQANVFLSLHVPILVAEILVSVLVYSVLCGLTVPGRRGATEPGLLAQPALPVHLQA